MSTRRWFSIVFAVFAATAIFLVIGFFHALKVVRDPDFPLVLGDPSLKLQDNAFQWRDKKCDVLIAGDSTAGVGIDPRLITAQTGLSACNIATNRPNVDHLGTLPVDAFLTHNPKPKLIVFQLGPEDFYRAKNGWENGGAYSSMLLLARDVPQSEVLRTMLKHPAEITQFVLYTLQQEIAPRRLPPALYAQYHRALAHAAESNGQLDLNLPAQTGCGMPALPLYGPLDGNWTRELHQRYEAQGIAVLVRAAPVPECDPQRAKFQQELGPYVDGPVEALPITDFVGGDRHTTQAGSQVDTFGLIALIRAKTSSLVR